MKDTIILLLLKFFEWRRQHPTFSKWITFLFIFWMLKFIKKRLRKRKSLRNQVVLITGGVSGIGRLLALQCKQRGAKVIVWDVNEDGINEMRNNVDLSMKCDVGDRSSVMQAAQHVLEKFRVVDILVNNAGIVSGKSILELTENQVRRTFNINIIAHFWTIQAFLPAMIEAKRGHIVVIASTAGISGISQLTDYCASKYACVGLDDSLRHELQTLNHHEIKLTSICPYFINTGMFDGATHAKFWWLRRAVYLLEPDYVVGEMIKAIEYEERNIILPYEMGKYFYRFEALLPYRVRDFLINSCANLSTFQGRKNHS